MSKAFNHDWHADRLGSLDQHAHPLSLSQQDVVPRVTHCRGAECRAKGQRGPVMLKQLEELIEVLEIGVLKTCLADIPSDDPPSLARRRDKPSGLVHSSHVLFKEGRMHRKHVDPSLKLISDDVNGHTRG